jgi:hypothetical protein
MAELREEVRKSDEAAVFFEERAKQYRAMFEHAEVEARADPPTQPKCSMFACAEGCGVRGRLRAADTVPCQRRMRRGLAALCVVLDKPR